MRYALGVDLGTTYTAAALARDGRTEIFTLGSTAPAIPSVVVVRTDNEILVGEAAERRSITEPTRTGREFKRRLGDPAPLILGGTPYGAEALMARLLRYVVDAVTEREGAPPSAITVTHPANYGPYKRDLLREMVRLADVGDVEFLTEPEAAAIEYARQNRIEANEVVAVYDFGGGTFDAAVLRKTPDAFEILGTPEGMERLGGIDFDQAVFQYVDDATGNQISELDTSDPQTRAALARLRADVRAAKESLSSDTDVTIPVMLPGLQTQVRLTRPEFEQMIRPRIADTIAAFTRAIRSAGVDLAQISRILLVGGSSRIPLVAEMVREATGRPAVVDAHPKFAIALGAAWHGATRLAAEEATRPMPPVAVTPARPAAPPVTAAAVSVAGEPPARAEREARARSPLLLVVGGLVALAVLAGLAFFALGLGGGSPSSTGSPLTGAVPSATVATGAAAATGEPTGVAATEEPAATTAATDVPTTPSATDEATVGPTTGASPPSGTPAGPEPGRVSSIAADAGLAIVGGIAVTPERQVFLMDDASMLRVVEVDGSVSQLGTLAELSGAGPFSVAIDLMPDGRLIATSPGTNQVFEIAADGTATRIAGREDAEPGTAGGSGPALDAEMWEPVGVAAAPDGSFFVSEYTNNRIDRIDVAGMMSTVTGDGPGTGGYNGDGGPAAEAQINGPAALALDAAGRLFFIDVANNRIRRIDTDGTISTVVGTGTDVAQPPVDGVVGTEQPITRNTQALAVDGAGNLYTWIEGFVVRVTGDGTLEVLAGGGDDIYAVDVPPDRIRLSDVAALEIDPSTGDLYIGDLNRVLVLPGVGETE